MRYVGPGFLISVAYMDPGNWATNIEGGARYGTVLLWAGGARGRLVVAAGRAVGSWARESPDENHASARTPAARRPAPPAGRARPCHVFPCLIQSSAEAT